MNSNDQYKNAGERSRHHRFSFIKSCVAVSERRSLELVPRATLIFIHGRFSCTESWLPLAKSLNIHFRCIFLDLPGFGNSFTLDDQPPSLVENSELLGQLVEEFSDGPVFLVAHDIGTAIVQLCIMGVQHNPIFRVAGLVFFNPLCIGRSIESLSLGYGGYFMRRRLQKALRECDALSFEQRALLEEPWNYRASRDPMLQALETFQHCWPGPHEQNTWKDLLGEVRIPVLLLQGARDPLNTPGHSYELIRRLPEAYYFQNEECSHWPSLEKPDWANDKMRTFLWRYTKGKPQMDHEPKKAA
jgi:abhydrolase domain-containing protein 6